MSQKVGEMQAFSKAVEFIKQEAGKKAIKDAKASKISERNAEAVKSVVKKEKKGRYKNWKKKPQVFKKKIRKFVRRKLTKEELMKKIGRRNGVVALSHIPAGFTEESLLEYFQQFGDVRNAKLCRSEKTGRSKGYAFIEYKYPEVAKIVADTMNNYVMGKRLLKAKVVSKTVQMSFVFKQNITADKFPGLTRRRKHAAECNKDKENKGRKLFKKHITNLRNNIQNLHAKGVLYTYTPEEDAVMKCIEDQVHQMKTTGSKQVEPEDQKNQVPSTDQNNLVPSGRKKPSKVKKEKIPSEVQEKKVITKNKKKLTSCPDSEKPVLEIDESDEEIVFKTPPNVIKRRLSALKPRSLSAKKQKFVVTDETENRRKILGPIIDSIPSTMKKTSKKKAAGEERLNHTNDSVSSLKKKSSKKEVAGVKKSAKADKLNKMKLQSKGNNEGKSTKLKKK